MLKLYFPILSVFFLSLFLSGGGGRRGSNYLPYDQHHGCGHSAGRSQGQDHSIAFLRSACRQKARFVNLYVFLGIGCGCLQVSDRRHVANSGC